MPVTHGVASSSLVRTAKTLSPNSSVLLGLLYFWDMAYFTYIIYSHSCQVYYKGSTQAPEKRLWEHNQDLSRYTKGKGPWKLVYLKAHSSKREALIAERKLKKAGSSYLKKLIDQYLMNQQG